MSRSAFAFPLLFVLLLAACSSFPTVRMFKFSPEKRDFVANELIVVHEPAPALKTFQSGKDKLNALIKIGKQVEQSDPSIHLDSVAPVIEGTLVKELKQKDIFVGQEKVIKQNAGEQELSTIAKAQGAKEGLIVDTQILGWDVTPHEKDKTFFNLSLNSNTRIYNIKKDQVVGQYYCHTATDYTSLEEAPTRYKLMKDNMALLKKLMKEQAQKCAKETVANIL